MGTLRSARSGAVQMLVPLCTLAGRDGPRLDLTKVRLYLPSQFAVISILAAKGCGFLMSKSHIDCCQNHTGLC